MSKIPNNINKEHIISAIQEIENNGISNSRRNATEYALLINNKEYPPKYVISIANKYANDEELISNDFNSIQSRTFLTNLGFECIKKSGSLKRNFAKWLLNKGKTSYKQYLGDSVESIELKLDEINNFFPEKDLFQLFNNDFANIKTFISNNIYGENRIKNERFFEYDNRNGNGIPKAIIGKKNYFVFLDKNSSTNQSLLKTKTMETINITGSKIYKISMGNFLKHKELDYIDPIKEFEANKLIVMHQHTANNQGNAFNNNVKIGDYIYLTYGQIRLSFIGKIISESKSVKEFIEINLDKNWVARKIEIIQNPLINNTKDISDIKLGWLPSGYSTFKEIPNITDANSILFNKFYGVEVVDDNINDNKKHDKKEILNQPVNQILYGPPGTGKTYKTKELAVQISNPGFVYDENWTDEEKREAIVNEYDKLCTEGKVVFTTFHQSMSYEDFVEGIKPKTEDNKVTYEIENGIFKELSLKASQKTISNFKEAYNQLIKEFSDNDNDFLTLKTPKDKEFRVRLNSNNNLSLFTTNKSSQQGTFTKEKLEQHLYYENAFNGWEGYANAILNYLKENFKLRTKGINYRNYTLIIDEINRGNVSAVFGELITLLEDDKRIGQKEAIKIKLPYSKDDFGVPSNLYIIGTMNTADRSVEALDTALRRRFSFTEVAPDSTLLEGKKVEDKIALEKLLQTINDRIEILIDKDHKIGHSYFLNIENLDDLKETFKNKVIPLLEEYFFGDYGKIGLILGSSFIKLKEDKDKVLFTKNFKGIYEDAENLREKAVYTFTDEDSWEASSFISIYEE